MLIDYMLISNTQYYSYVILILMKDINEVILVLEGLGHHYWLKNRHLCEWNDLKITNAGSTDTIQKARSVVIFWLKCILAQIYSNRNLRFSINNPLEKCL